MGAIPNKTAHTVLIIFAAALLSLCQVVNNLGQLPASPSPDPTGGGGPAQSWYSVYFTDPSSPQAGSYHGGPDEALAEAMDGARESIDVAVLEFNLYSLRDALVAAHKRGVRVRMVIDSDSIGDPEVRELAAAGIPVLGDRREGLMHNKFSIIDGQEVWTGSMNYTASDTYRNNNNLIRIRSSRLAQDYESEFEEMFVDDLFGPDLRPATPYPAVTVDGVLVEVYFSPDDGTAAHLVDLVDGAQESVYILAYSFTSNDLARAVLGRMKAGVEVAAVFEESQVESNTGGEFENFRSQGLDVRLDGNPRNMHDKVLIIDRQIVVTGSYNFSSNAERTNDENTLVIYSPEIAARYLEEFQRIYGQAER